MAEFGKFFFRASTDLRGCRKTPSAKFHDEVGEKMAVATAVQAETVIRVTSGGKQIGQLTFADAKNVNGKTLRKGGMALQRTLGPKIANRLILCIMGQHTKNNYQNFGQVNIGDKCFTYAALDEADAPKSARLDDLK